LISINGFLKISIRMLKMPTGTVVKFWVSASKELRRVPLKLRHAYETSIYVTSIIIFLMSVGTSQT